MNKLTALLMIIALSIFGLSACGQADDENLLRVGMDLEFPPYSYIDDEGNPAGLEPAIAHAFGEYIGMEVEIVDTDFGLLLGALEVGDLDILIADMSVTEERMEKANFSDPYRYSQTLALVNKDFALANNITDQMPAEEFFNLADAKFIGLAGTFGVTVPESFGVEVNAATEIGNAILEVAGGQSTTLVASSEIHSFHAANPDTTIVYSNIGNNSASCFVVALDNQELLTKSNEFIATMYEEGGLYDQIRAEFDPIIGDFLKNPDLGLDYIVNEPASN